MMIKWYEGNVSVGGTGKIFSTKVDSIKKTKGEIKKETRCKPMKGNYFDCPDTSEWNKAYDILLMHQKRYVTQMQAIQAKKEREIEKLQGIVAM